MSNSIRHHAHFSGIDNILWSIVREYKAGVKTRDAATHELQVLLCTEHVDHYLTGK